MIKEKEGRFGKERASGSAALSLLQEYIAASIFNMRWDQNLTYDTILRYKDFNVMFFVFARN